jgi:hypothetical protein
MHKYFFIGIGLFVIMLSSCRSHRQVVQHDRIDSTTISYREVEKIVHIPGDSVSVTMQASTNSDSGAPTFVPQVQNIETKRTKVTIELTKTGEIKATAVSKDLEEKVTVLEKTITKSKSDITVVQDKENFLQRFQKSLRTILITLVLIAAIYTAFKLGFNPISIVKNLFKKS